MRALIAIPVGIALAVLPDPLRSQPATETHAEAPTAHAAESTGVISLDGSVIEGAWENAPPITAFTQVEPNEGAVASEATEVRLLYDRDVLYVSAVLHSEAPISSRLARRDLYLPDSDWFAVSLDTHHDHRTAYRFMVNPSGVKIDAVISAEGQDPSWDPVWDVKALMTDSGWSLEMRIPFTQLRFGSVDVQVWGIQLEREIAGRREKSQFAFTPRRESGGVPRYGHLRGIAGLTRGRGVDLLPYVVARSELRPVESQEGAPFGNPYRGGADLSGAAGMDMKVRLASNLTIDATVNPDFGQVEVDPAVVNLTQFETRFDEKRPFFVEGASIFEFGDDLELLHSRRIGDSPRWSAPREAIFEDAPAATTILGAAKLTGRSPGGWSIGLLEAVTAEEYGRYIDVGGTEHTAPAAPLTNFAAGRLHRSFDEDRSSVGALATAVHRGVGGSDLVDRLPSAAYAGGMDFRQRWADNAWSLSGHIAGSQVEGSPAAIERLQRTSARYFQRPDADHLTMDPGATSLSGYAVNLRLTKHAGLHWRGRALVAATSPGFEVNDAGFQSSADRISTHMRILFVEERPGARLRQWSISGGPDTRWNYGGDRLAATVSAEANAQLLNYWSGEIRLDRDLAGLDDRRTRGGPLTRGLGSSRVSFLVRSDNRKAWVASLETDHRRNEAGGGTDEIGLALSVRPAESWSLSLEPRLERNREAAQFIRSVADTIAISTFGRRYLFADLDETTLALEARLNVTFRPGLTLELFTQPFLAAASFGRVKELHAPRTFSFLEYGADVGTVARANGVLIVDPDGPGPAASFGVDDEDFRTRSLRGNAVLRWEWRPGSTAFLVWQQSRSDLERIGEFDFRRQAGELFAARPANTIMLKVSYWFSR